MDNLARCAETISMAIRTVYPDHGYDDDQPPAHFIAHWRYYRRKSQESTAAAAQMVSNNLSQLENYKQGWSPEGLTRIADFLKTTPGALLMINPLRPGEAAFWEAWNRASREDREYLGEIVPSLLRRHQRPGSADDAKIVDIGIDAGIAGHARRSAATQKPTRPVRPSKYSPGGHGRNPGSRR